MNRKRYAKWENSAWYLRLDPDCMTNIAIEPDGKIRLSQLLRGYAIIISRNDARLLARRINQALEASKR